MLAGVVVGELGAGGCEPRTGEPVAECSADEAPDLGWDVIDRAELTARRGGDRRVPAGVDRVRNRDVFGDGVGDVRATDFVPDLDPDDDKVDSVSDGVGVGDDDGDDVGQRGVVSWCSRCTMRNASDLLLAVMPDSTWERHAGFRSDIFRPVLRYTSENFSGPNDASTPW